MIRIVESNVSSNLPSRINNFLQDFAQSYEGIDHNDIFNLSNYYRDLHYAKNVFKLNNLVSTLTKDLKEVGMDAYEASKEYEDIKENCDKLVTLIKNFDDVESYKLLESTKSESLDNLIFKEYSKLGYELKDGSIIYNKKVIGKYGQSELRNDKFFLPINIKDSFHHTSFLAFTMKVSKKVKTRIIITALN